MPREGYLDIEQVADKFAVSRRTIERIVEKLELKRYKFKGDKKLYYLLEDLQLIEAELDRTSPNVKRDSSAA